MSSPRKKQQGSASTQGGVFNLRRAAGTGHSMACCMNNKACPVGPEAAGLQDETGKERLGHTIRSLRCHRCTFCGRCTPLRDLTRTPGCSARGSPTVQQVPQSSQPVRPGDPFDDSPLPNCPLRDTVLTESDSYSPNFAEHPRWHSRAVHCLSKEP